MKKVLFATTNPAKIFNYKEKLEKQGFEVLTLKDVDVKLDIDESGKNAVENAIIKAKAYYEKTHIVSISVDNNLFIEGVPDEKQPGTHVRRVGGKELSDEEMIKYYSNLVGQYGGKMTSKWVNGIAIYNENGANTYTWNGADFYLVNKPAEKVTKGYPLDSISIIPECDNKYCVYLTKEDRNKINKNNTLAGPMGFLINNLK